LPLLRIDIVWPDKIEATPAKDVFTMILPREAEVKK
jgi:hypothetical protein